MGRKIDDGVKKKGVLTDTGISAETAQEWERIGKAITAILTEEGAEQGALKSCREILLRQLRLKFKRVPAAIKEEINATQDVKKLDEWLDDIVFAKTLFEIRFSSRPWDARRLHPRKCSQE